MKKIFRNIYREARVSAELTQIMAAEYLNVSVRSLADYETSKTIPGDDIVCTMVKIYKARWLAYKHLKENTMIGKLFLPDVEFADLARTVLRLQKELADLKKVTDSMIEIACDSIVDDTEKQLWDKITKEIDDVAGAAIALVLR